MFITSDRIEAEAMSLQPQRIKDGTVIIARAACRVFGLALIMAASGLWVLPESTFETNLLLIKLGLSVCAFCAGLGFMQQGLMPPAPEVQIDTVRREIRIVQMTNECEITVLQSCRFDALSHVERDGSWLRFWCRDGEFLAEVNLSDPNSMERVLGHLRDAMRPGHAEKG